MLKKIDLKLPKSVLLLLSVLLFLWIHYIFYQYFFNYCEYIRVLSCRVNVAISVYWSATFGWIWLLLWYFYIRSAAFIISFLVISFQQKFSWKDSRHWGDDVWEYIRLTNMLVPSIIKILLVSAILASFLLYVLMYHILPYFL